MGSEETRTVYELDNDRKRTLLNILIKQGKSEELAKQFGVSIPSRITVAFHCPQEDEDFTSRLFTKDMLGMKRYMTCPNCRSQAPILNIGRPDQASEVTKRAVQGLDLHFD